MTTQTDSTTRANDILQSAQTDFTVSDNGFILWKDEKIASLKKGDNVLSPTAVLLTADDAENEQIVTFINHWLSFHLNKVLSPLYHAVNVAKEETCSENARFILTFITEKLGVIRREKIKEQLKILTEDDKKTLAKAGIRTGYNFLFFPMLLKPATQRLVALLWKIDNDKLSFDGGLAIDGKMSVEVNPDVPRPLYLVQGYIWAGKRAIRVDVMERFTSKLRELTRQDKEKTHPLPLDLLSTAGLKRDEAPDVFGFLGFDVIKETIGEGEEAKETLMIRPKPKKVPFHKKKITHPKRKKDIVVKQEPVDLSDSPFACLAVLKKKQ